MNPTQFTDSTLPPVVVGGKGDKTLSSSPIISVIMHSRGRPDLCKTALDSLVATCSDPQYVEVVMKIDSDDPTAGDYLNVLRQTPFHFKLLTYDRLDAYWSVHIFQDDLSRIANGSILWCFNEDNTIVGGDWVAALKGTRDIYPDNIYVVKVPGAPPRKYKTVAPAYSKEWFNVLGRISPHIYSDRFLCNMATSVGRLVTTPEVDRIQFRHRHHEKIGRPPINLNHQAMTDRLNVFLKELRPKFAAAIGIK
jgi:hypothetical protein